jgi:hypothetical protein
MSIGITLQPLAGPFVIGGEAVLLAPDLFRHACLLGVGGPGLQTQGPSLPRRPIAALDQGQEPQPPRDGACDGLFLMLVYCAKNCDTVIETEVIDLGAGAGRIRCLECGGDGDWSKFVPDMVPIGMKCVDCKGSGYQLVSV